MIQNLSGIAIITLLTFLYPSPPARAAACCTSATAVGMGRLLSWERFATGLITSFSHEVGLFDPDGRWEPHDSGAKLEFRTSAWALVGINRRISLFGQLPWVMPVESNSNGARMGYGVGDLKAGLRYQLFDLGEYLELPAIALIGGVVFPTGSPPPQPNWVDITDRGAWALALAGNVEKSFGPWFLQSNLGLTLPLPRTIGTKGQSLWYGPGVIATCALGREVLRDFVLSGMADFSYEYYSNGYKAGLGLASSWRFDPHLTLTTSASSNLPLTYLGKGLPGTYALAIGLRYGYF